MPFPPCLFQYRTYLCFGDNGVERTVQRFGVGFRSENMLRPLQFFLIQLDVFAAKGSGFHRNFPRYGKLFRKINGHGGS